MRTTWMIVPLVLSLGLAACDTNDEQPSPELVEAALRGANLLVDDDRVQCPGADHTSLQDAVDAAQPGQTIFVCSGLYAGTVTVPAGKTGLTLLGAGGAPADRIGDPTMEAILDGSPAEEPGFDIQADSVAITGFTVQNTGRTGIEIKAEDGVTLINGAMVSGNRLDTTGDPEVAGTDCAGGRGINFELVADILVEDNVVISPCGGGIRLKNVTGGIVQNNLIDGSRKRPGIPLRGGSSNNTIAGNVSRNNREAGISAKDSTGNLIEANMMQDNGVPGEPLRPIPGSGSNTDADDDTNLPLTNPPDNTWLNNDCATANRAGLC